MPPFILACIHWLMKQMHLLTGGVCYLATLRTLQSSLLRRLGLVRRMLKVHGTQVVEISVKIKFINYQKLWQ